MRRGYPATDSPPAHLWEAAPVTSTRFFGWLWRWKAYWLPPILLALLLLVALYYLAEKSDVAAPFVYDLR